MEEQSKEEKLDKLVEYFTDDDEGIIDVGELSILYLMTPELREKLIKKCFNKSFKSLDEAYSMSGKDMQEEIKKQKGECKDELGFDVSPFIDFSPMLEKD